MNDSSDSNQGNSEKISVKCVLAGSAGVGKSCLVTRFLHGRFDFALAATIAAAFGSREVRIQNKIVRLNIWDTAGSEKFKSMTRHYFRGAEAACVCFDLTQRESFEDLGACLEEVVGHAVEGCLLIVVGCKLDLCEGKEVGESKSRSSTAALYSRQVSYTEAAAFAKKVGALYIETSARTGQNVEEPFVRISHYMLNKAQAGERVGTDKSAVISLDPFGDSGGNQDDQNVPAPRRKKCC